jgi:hypothetical protein
MSDRWPEGYRWLNIAVWPEKGEPYRCPECNTSRLECFISDDYETSVRCPDCKVWGVVHSG